MKEKEIKFLALIIPVKDVKGFLKEFPKNKDKFRELERDYMTYRQQLGKKPYNNYVIINQDEAYIDKIWEIILKEGKEE